jgi:hypothetical protein
VQVVEELEGFGLAAFGTLDGFGFTPSFGGNRVVVQNDGPP